MINSVVNNATTHKIAARHLVAALGARVGFLSNVATDAVLQPVLTAAWKDTRLALGERSAPVAYQAQYLSAGIKPGPSEAIIEHLPFCSDPPLPARDRAVNWGWLYLHRLAPFYSGAA